MCRPFMATYAPRTLSTMRIWDTTDPQTQEQTKIESTMAFANPHRVIRMPASNHPYPSASAPHTWQGYSTGKWVGNVLWVHTDHLKQGYLQRSQGLLLSDKTTMDERIFRYDNILVDIMMISDPADLSRPFIYSKLYAYIPQGNMDPYPCAVHNQVPAPEGYVPMKLPFYTTNYNDLFFNKGIPIEAAKGGEQTMFPDIRKLSEDPAAQSAIRAGPSGTTEADRGTERRHQARGRASLRWRRRHQASRLDADRGQHSFRCPAGCPACRSTRSSQGQGKT